MDYLDLDSFRSRYTDITVTAVPPKQECEDVVEHTPEKPEVPPHVQIMPMCPSSFASSTPSGYPQLQQHNREQQEAVAYANEYKQVLAKLEYTKYVQAQLQLMSMSNGQLCPNNFGRWLCAHCLGLTLFLPFFFLFFLSHRAQRDPQHRRSLCESPGRHCRNAS